MKREGKAGALAFPSRLQDQREERKRESMARSTGELISITGLDEVAAALLDAPRAIVASGFAKAGRAAADVIEPVLLFNTPVRSEDLFNPETFERIKGSEVGGALRDATRSDVELDSGFRGVNVSVSHGNMSWIANLLEYGHKMVAHGATKQDRENKYVGKLLGSGFVPAHPFMRKTFDETADQAFEAFESVVASTVKEIYG